MTWIEQLYHITDKDLYSQYGEAKYLEHILNHLSGNNQKRFIDIGAAGDELSNTRYFYDKGFTGLCLDKIHGQFITVENILQYLEFDKPYEILSIDIDGNDYWILDEILRWTAPTVIVAEFNAHYTDSRTIKYDPKFEWGRDSYYGFTFEAGLKLAAKWNYKVIFQNDNLNMYFVRQHLIEIPFPQPTYEKIEVFPQSERNDWIYVN